MKRLLVACGVILSAGLAVTAAAKPGAPGTPGPAAPIFSALINVSNVMSQTASLSAGPPALAANPAGGASVVARIDQIYSYSSTALGGGFSQSVLDGAAAGKAFGLTVARHLPGGDILAAWSLATNDLSDPRIQNSVIQYTTRAGNNPVTWAALAAVPGSQRAFGSAEKDLDMQTTADGQVYMLWSRSTTPQSAHLGIRDTTGAWSVIPVPLPADTTGIADFNLGVTRDHQVFVTWRKVLSTTSGELWVARYVNGQWIAPERLPTLANGYMVYHARVAADPLGGLRIIWMQGVSATPNADVFYDEWTPSAGWGRTPHQFGTAGNVGGNDYDLVVDNSGQAHIAWADNGAGPAGVLYSAGQGQQFSTPQLISADRQLTGNVALDLTVTQGHQILHVAFKASNGHIDPVTQRPYYDDYYTTAALGPLATATPSATNSPTATPTITLTPVPCGTDFTDVPPSNIFYSYIMDLVARQAISGYADCTFRPTNMVSRGQVTKVLVLALGQPVTTAGGPHFTDVGADNVFYPYVETAVNAGWISGYDDATHCGTAIPCFRPASNVTRGQISKMVSLARGWALPQTGPALFTDVLVGSPAYPYVAAAVAHGVITGYGDASRCPTGIPCFRPENRASRGQTAKIVDLALTPPATPTVTPTLTGTPGL